MISRHLFFIFEKLTRIIPTNDQQTKYNVKYIKLAERSVGMYKY